MSLDSFDSAQAFVAVHWIGMLLGLGAAAIADALGARMLLSSRPGPGRGVLIGLHVAICVAILLLLSSGAGLIVLRADQWCGLPDNVLRLGPACIPYKLAVKLVLMSVLIGVALLIEIWLLPLSRRRERPLIMQLSAFELARASAIVAASFTCWITLAAIPQMEALQSRPPRELLPAVAALWLAIAMAGSVGLMLARWYLGLAHKDADRQEEHAPARAASFVGTQVAAGGAFGHNVLSHPAAVARQLGVSRIGSSQSHQAATVDTTARREPAEHLEPAHAAMAVLRPAMWGTFAISFVINALMLTGPLYMLQVYDRVLTSRSTETLAVLTVLIVGLFAVLGLLDLIRARILSRVSIRIDAILAPPLLAAAVRVAPQRNRAAQPSPTRDLDQVCQFVSGPAVPAMLDLPWTPLYFALVFLLHPLLGFVALAGAAVLLALSILNQTLTKKPLAQSAEASARCDSMVEAGWRGAETLHALGMAGTFRRRWLAEHAQVLSVQQRAGDRAGRIGTATKVTRMLLQSLLIGAGAWLALHDAVSAGAMIAVSIIAGRALAPIEQLVAFWRSIGAAQTAAERCRTCLAEAPSRDASIALPRPRGALAVTNLFVAPPGASQPVIRGLSFRLEPGDVLAVVGPSAAGKSTLARALVGVWPARAGDVRLDGAALAQWDADALGRHVGYLPQDALLFDGTIAENIARLEPNADSQGVIAAARAAGVHEMILRLEHGYATRVGDGGVALPGGQRQRIALARALYGDPVLIVMDEPNANLDAAGEAALIEAIGLLRAAKRTVVVMAHRRSVLATVNLVLVLNEGRQSAFGPPDKIFKSEAPRKREAVHAYKVQPARAGHGEAR